MTQHLFLNVKLTGLTIKFEFSQSTDERYEKHVKKNSTKKVNRLEEMNLVYGRTLVNKTNAVMLLNNNWVSKDKCNRVNNNVILVIDEKPA
ncbi:9597_t:CDS:2 [Funneliformis mosseae]|uniref:9597_t:CDS:1 n=1 Tax=Funneliformis mosseae TaxID=27381 RepID=A0A9N9B751_FUNMO|nr:9597_t:CDS:2 [Funneliformis mosseae]